MWETDWIKAAEDSIPYIFEQLIENSIPFKEKDIYRMITEVLHEKLDSV